jgi:hypothetical protein
VNGGHTHSLALTGTPRPTTVVVQRETTTSIGGKPGSIASADTRPPVDASKMWMPFAHDGLAGNVAQGSG